MIDALIPRVGLVRSGFSFTSVPSVTGYPKWIGPEFAAPHIASRFDIEVFESFAVYCEERRPERLAFKRTYALGDVIMLLPVIRCLHETLELSRPIDVLTDQMYLGQLKQCADDRVRFRPWVGLADYGADVHMDLDRVLEADHTGGPASHHHRLELYGAALGFNVTWAAA